jgi:endoglucanase
MFLSIRILNVVYLSVICAYPWPYSTSGNTIVDADGHVVRLRCVNWPGSMETLLPEGLQHNSIDNIVRLIEQLNITCVRLTYSIDAARTENLTVYQSLSQWNLTSAIEGIRENNPSLINSSTSNAFDAVLNRLGQSNIVILLDNHVSKAMWCCNDLDGNGFWNDRFFDVEQWITGLQYMTRKTIDRPYVIAMSLRNELRGLRQNRSDWYHYVLRGIREAISLLNPRLLIVISGLDYDLNLKFVQTRSIQELVPHAIRKQIVYEAHWYSWSNYGHSTDCDKMQAGIYDAWAFLLELNRTYTAPMWLTEFGTNVDQFTGNDPFIDCVRDFLRQTLTSNVSWSYWVLAGSYYLRSGIVESHEAFGLLTDNWKEIKSNAFANLLSSM